MKENLGEDTVKAWKMFLRIIKDQISYHTYENWFAPIRPLYLQKNILTVQVPSQFFSEWLGEHYALLLKKTVRHVLGESGELKYLILTKQIVDFELDESIKENSIISITSQVNEKMIAYFSKKPYELKVMNRRLFEEFIAEIFNGFGFKIELTKQTRDGGRDIIAIKHDVTELKYLIECKRPDPGNPISIHPVRELFGVKKDEKATKAILATTSYFTPDAIKFSERNKWELELKNFNGIMKWIEDYKLVKNIAK